LYSRALSQKFLAPVLVFIQVIMQYSRTEHFVARPGDLASLSQRQSSIADRIASGCL
jgi:hypothetical protein